MNINSIFSESGLNLNTGDSSIYITNLGASVERKYLNDSYSYGNVFNFDVEGTVYKPYTTENLQKDLYDKIKAIADSGRYNFRIKSLNFPNSLNESSEGIRFLKFSAAVEFHQNETGAHSKFLEFDTNNKADNKNFLEPAINNLQNFATGIKDYSENFNFDEGENGECKFTHSVNLGLLPETGGDIFSVIKKNNLRTTAQSIVSNSKNYSNFTNLAKLFTGNGFVFKNSSWADHFSAANDASFTNSETIDFFANSYSLTRNKTYYTGYNADYFFNHSYELSVGGDGTIEISENTEMKGGTTFAALKAKFDSDIEGASSPFTNGDSTFNVKKSYTRCQEFLKNYRYFLRKTKAETDTATYLNHYNNSTSLYSLRPIPMERSFSSIPELPAITHSVKYTTNPNLQYGYESKESVKLSKNGSIINASHSFNVKSISFKTGDLSNFSTVFGTTSAGITNFQTFTAKAIERSKIFVHDLMNGSQIVNLKNLKYNSDIKIGLALIKKNFNIPRRGKDFSLTLEYTSEDKYAPLYYSQNPQSLTANAPDKSTMFNNLLIPTSAHQYISDKFSFFDKRVNITVPTEKFTERIVLNRGGPAAKKSIIDPSFQSSTGKMSITFSCRIKNKNPPYQFYANGVHLFGSGKYIEDAKGIVDDLFGIKSILSPVIHATVNSEISKIIDEDGAVGTHVLNAYVPSSVKFEIKSDFNLEISFEIEFYSKSRSSKRKPIFGFKGNKIYPGNIDTASIFDQENSF